MSSSTLYASLQVTETYLYFYKGMWDMECLLNENLHKDLTPPLPQNSYFVYCVLFCPILSLICEGIVSFLIKQNY